MSTACSVAVLAPLAGRLLPLSEVPDPVFSAEMVGPGVAIDPSEEQVTAVSPIAGTVVKAHPHAFVVLGPDGVGVLVHLGIDTVRLDGKGFELHVSDGDTVASGDPMVTWDVSVTRAEGLSPVVPVVAMDRPKGSVPAPDGRIRRRRRPAVRRPDGVVSVGPGPPQGSASAWAVRRRAAASSAARVSRWRNAPRSPMVLISGAGKTTVV